METRVLITGADGQLGKSLQYKLKDRPEYHLILSDLNVLDISKASQVIRFLKNHQPQIVINAAAYTAVDKAEEEKDLAYKVNETGPLNLAKACRDIDCPLFHISTDYVYNGKNKDYQSETDATTPEGTYARSKLQGENRIREHWDKHFILRTSWLYSEFGNNFVKTMLKLGAERKTLSVVNDQIGSPTYAGDLAGAISTMMDYLVRESGKQSIPYGVYNYSNKGDISWFDFAVKIFEIAALNVDVKPVSSGEYPVLAPRPLNSKLAIAKIEKTFDLEIPLWEDSLRLCMNNLAG
jgi:dTDP-4-dehydrorhamnose reductase